MYSEDQIHSPVWHVVPENPSLQAHVKPPLTAPVHVPAFLHGLGEQASTKEYYDGILNIITVRAFNKIPIVIAS